MTKQYTIAFFASAILLIGVLVGYGIYVNGTSNAHVAKMAASQYFKVKSSPVSYREIAPVVSFSVVNIYAPKMTDVHFEIDGTLVGLYVKPGDRVRAGQLLGELDNNELPAEVLQAEGKVRAAEANVIKWGNMTRRYQSLVAQNAVSLQQLDEAVTSLGAAEGELAAAQAYYAQLSGRLGKRQIVAPFDGDILQVYHTQGTVVRNGGSLVMLGELSSLFFRNNVSNDILAQLQPLTGTFRLAVKRTEVMEKAYIASTTAGSSGGNDFELQITEVTPPLNVPAQYRTVMYKINNAAGLLEPGTYYQAKIYGTSKRQVLAVPRDAVIGDTEPYVFVIGSDSRLERRPVSAGIRDDEYVEVLEGVQENELVAVTGKDTELTPGMKVQLL